MTTPIAGPLGFFLILLAAGAQAHSPIDNAAGEEPSIQSTEQQLVNPDQGPDDRASRVFGQSVAVSGRTALVGAIANDDRGAVYQFERNAAGEWVFRAKIAPPDQPQFAGFGSSIAFDGFSALIGAPSQGVVYYYVLHKRAFHLQQVLLGPQGHRSFGTTLALHGCDAMIADTGSSEAGSASVSVWDRCNRHGLWRREQLLHAADSDPSSFFGASLALETGEMLIGAWSGSEPAAFYYVRRHGLWIEQQKLVTADARAGNGFGRSVAFDGRVAVIGDSGANFIDPGTPQTGAVYVFVRASHGWVEEDKLVPLAGQTSDEQWAGYGTTVVLSNDHLVVGAPDPFARGDDLPGRIFIYERRRHHAFDFVESLAGHEQVANYGAALSISGHSLLVGEPALRLHFVDVFDGAAYAVRLPGH
jgi:hypothetical protein